MSPREATSTHDAGLDDGSFPMFASIKLRYDDPPKVTTSLIAYVDSTLHEPRHTIPAAPAGPASP
jgi:hypothetical protein